MGRELFLDDHHHLSEDRRAVTDGLYRVRRNISSNVLIFVLCCAHSCVVTEHFNVCGCVFAHFLTHHFEGATLDTVRVFRNM